MPSTVPLTLGLAEPFFGGLSSALLPGLGAADAGLAVMGPAAVAVADADAPGLSCSTTPASLAP